LTERGRRLYVAEGMARGCFASLRALGSELVGNVMSEGSAHSALLTARPARAADALARLAAGTAHELNNPLSVVVGYLGLILAGRTAPAQLEAQLRMVAAEAQYCRNVLQGLTELAECTLAEPETLDLRGVLVEAQATHGEPSPLVMSIVGDAPAPVIGQARGLAALVSHAVRNAVEASARSLSMQVTQSQGTTVLELCDDGRGMPAQLLARARDPFFTTKEKHLGLGLAICDAVAWSHGGTLVVSSREERGTTLRLTLPTSGAEGTST